MKLLPVVLLLALSSCSIVKAARIRDDWAQADQRAVRRLVVVVQPLPEGNQKAGEAFARIARRYVNQKRDFLVKKEVVLSEAPKLAELCGGEDAIEGVLFLKPSLKAAGSGFEAELSGALARCTDGREAWTGQAAGSFPAKDPGLVEVTANYVQELGPEVDRYVPPAMNLLRPLLDTLPQPILTEADVDEKLTLD
jgi:probable lipoprotein (TIGR04455 family)